MHKFEFRFLLNNSLQHLFTCYTKSRIEIGPSEKVYHSALGAIQCVGGEHSAITTPTTGYTSDQVVENRSKNIVEYYNIARAVIVKNVEQNRSDDNSDD